MLPALLLATALSLRDIVVVNQSPEAIFTVRVGHVADGTWSDDLLGFARVIDVSRGVAVRFPVDLSVCNYDVQATLRSGTVVVVPSVNLCAADHLDVKPN